MTFIPYSTINNWRHRHRFRTEIIDEGPTRQSRGKIKAISVQAKHHFADILPAIVTHWTSDISSAREVYA